MANPINQLFQDESTKKGKIGGSIKRILVGTVVGVSQGVVESNDRAILGMKMSTLVPAVITVGGIAVTMLSKSAKIRSVGADATVAGSVILGQKFVAPEITKLVHRSTLGRTFMRGGKPRKEEIPDFVQIPSQGNPFGYINQGLFG